MVFPLWKEIVVTCNGLGVFAENISENLKILGQKIESAAKEDENAKVVDFWCNLLVCHGLKVDEFFCIWLMKYLYFN